MFRRKFIVSLALVCALAVGGGLIAVASAASSAAKPDLVGKIVQISPATHTLHRGQGFDFVVRVTNRGRAPAVGRIALDFLSQKGPQQGKCRQWLRVNLAPGASANCAFDDVGPTKGTALGRYTLSVKIDATKVIAESNELNNVVAMGVYRVVR